MDIFKEIREMEFGKAYGEMVSVFYEEAKDIIHKQREKGETDSSSSDTFVKKTEDKILFG